MINGFHIPGDPRLCTHLGTGVSLKALLLQSSELLESLSPRLPNRPGNTVPSLCSAGVPAEGFSSSHPTQFPHEGDAERSHQWEELLPYRGCCTYRNPKGKYARWKKIRDTSFSSVLQWEQHESAQKVLKACLYLWVPLSITRWPWSGQCWLSHPAGVALQNHK